MVTFLSLYQSNKDLYPQNMFCSNPVSKKNANQSKAIKTIITKTKTHTYKYVAHFCLPTAPKHVAINGMSSSAISHQDSGMYEEEEVEQ